MKKEKATVTKKRKLTNCWIYENGRYIHVDEMQVGQLPYVAAKDECVLKENAIPYRSSYRYGKEVFEYWNPECFEEEVVVAPLYAKMFGKYQNLNKKHTGKKPTIKMLEMAEKFREEVVSQAVENHHLYLKRQALYKEAKDALAGRVVTIKKVKHHGFVSDAKHYGSALYSEFEMEGNHIICFPVLDAKGNYMETVAMFNMNKVAPGGYLTLQVKDDLIGWIKGKKGNNIRKWTEKVGAKKIFLVC